MSLFTCPYGVWAPQTKLKTSWPLTKSDFGGDHLEVGGFGSWLLEAADITQRSRSDIRLNDTICGRVARRAT